MRRLALVFALAIGALMSAIALPALACAPADLRGPGTQARFEFGDTADAVGWWRPRKYGAPSRVIYAAKHSWLTSAAKASLAAVAKAPDPAAAIASAAASNVTLSASSFSVALALAAKLDAERPPNPRWLVAKNGTTATRPTRSFLWNDQARPFIVGDSKVRIAVGSVCRCQDAVVEVGSTSWCQVGREAVEGYVMAVCARQ